MRTTKNTIGAGIAGWSIRHPVGVVMITLAVVVLGLFALGNLKIDLLPHVPFDPERCVRDARRIRADLPVLRLSARTGEGLDAWLEWAGLS